MNNNKPDKSVELIIFDWDGTLMDSEAKIVNCFRKAVADVGIDYPGDESTRNIIGLGLKEALDILLPGFTGAIRQQVVDSYREHFLHLDETEMLLFKGVEEGLKRLQSNNYSLAIATGKARTGLDRVLEYTQLGEYFVASRCADEAKSKPHPRMVLDLLAGTRVSADNAIVVGDTTYDIQMAHRAGTDALAVCYGVHSSEKLKAENPLACVDDFDSVIEWFV
ncbi:5'-nucleotidase [bacterium BMS3Bbin11]|nr:5'-nucleotidase [bacterium BMS3Abin11]GBE46353.1 5'-nucleotidase [bacterium BMS3Bbin11]HDH09009.1 HAD family hydrolase [Gammaproteobacteria bacterium]HDH15619.1 HAD family hydrolase [Gammaproteobacteria bacterium]HDZ79230.1 HAD family hydrolase [Gammaproteobacteria bacterium]